MEPICHVLRENTNKGLRIRNTFRFVVTAPVSYI